MMLLHCHTLNLKLRPSAKSGAFLYHKCRRVPIPGNFDLHHPELFILLAAIVMAQSPGGFVGRGSGAAFLITTHRQFSDRRRMRTRVAGRPQPRLLTIDLRQQLDNPLREYASHCFEVARLMKRVLDLMAELLCVRAALQAAGSSSAGDVLDATAALEGAICARLSVSRQFSLG